MKPPKKKATLPNGYLPFPVMLKKTASQPYYNLIPKMRGTLTEACDVIVSAPGDMALLYNMGFFGKGTLSKHEPVFHRVVEQPVDVIKQHLESVSMERYKMAAVGDLRDRPVSIERVCPDNMITKLDSVPTESSEQESTTPELLATSPFNPIDDMDWDEDELPIGATASTSVNYEQIVSWTEEPADEEFWSSDRLPQFELPDNIDQVKCIPADSMENTTTLQHLSATPQIPTLASQDITCTTQPDGEIDIGSDTTDAYTYSADDEDYVAMSRLDIQDTEEDKSEYLSLREELQLDSYEALFLMLSFGCLITTDKEGVDVDYIELWHRCLAEDKQFLPRYAVYHHIRAKGWIPKDGLTYGCNFVVYKRGPKYYHSSVGVLVKCVDAETTQELEEFSETKLSWAKILGLNRVMNNVRKELMICYVLMPRGLTQSEIEESPVTALKRLTICETLVNRVVPSRELTGSNLTLHNSNVSATNKNK